MVCIDNCMQGRISNPALPLSNNDNKKQTRLATLERDFSDSLVLQCRGYLDNFSHSQDYRHTQNNPRSPDFTPPKLVQEAWCIHNPYLVQEEVTVQGAQPTEDVKDGEVRVIGMYYKEQEEKAALIVNNSNHETSQDDIAAAVTFVALLKSCTQRRDLHEGSKLHTDIVKRGLLKKNVFVGTALLNMYAKCGALEKAQEVFDELPFPNIVSWTALITGYAQHGNGESALKCFKQMQLEGFSPNAVTFACILKACGIVGALDKGQEIHAQIGRERLLEQDVVVANALIDMYVKCGALEKAQEVFDELSVRDVVSCNSLIAGYVQHEQNKEALQLFEGIKLKGFSPNTVTFASILKACGGISLDKGKEIHAQIVRESMLQNDIVIAGAVVDMYAKCGALKKAQEVFDELPFWNVVLWNGLIAGYVQYGHGEEALNCFERMQIGGFSPNAVTLTCILTACGSIGALDQGQESHAQIVRENLQEQDIVVANALVDMYAKCGALERAHQLLIEIAAPDMVSWNVLIAGYAQHGHGEEALGCFEQMQLEGFSPDAFTTACILKACGSLGAADKGHTIHTQIVHQGSLQEENVVANALVDMYAKCGELENAQKVFDKLSCPDIVSWNALISGHVHYGQGEKALHYLERMKSEGCSPNAFTFACTLKGCGGMRALGKGRELHAQIVKDHLLGKDDMVANALTDMYAKCSEPERAQEVFDGLLVQDVVSWNALITGYAQHRLSEKALNGFDRMQSAGSLPNAITFACNLKACGSIRALQKGQQLHAQIVGEPLLVEDVVVGTAIVDMYARCGAMETAEKVFNELSIRDVISWNVLITGYTQNNCAEEALSCFEQMQLNGFSSDAATYSCILKACGSLGAAFKGLKLHAEVVIFGALEESIMVGTALVVLYANCGMLTEAQEVFDRLPFQDVVSWSGLMVGYAQLGKANLVFSLFDKMVRKGIEPSMVTFTIVLNACSHGGLLVEGQGFFEYISKGFNLIPTLEHYTCMVNLFGCAGNLEKAVVVIEGMPGFTDLTMWHTLLGVCERWGNVNLGKWAFEHAVRLDDKDPAVYVCMSNIYAAARRQEDECKLKI